MKNIKFIVSIIAILFAFASCKKVTNDDLSFVKTAAAPQKISVMFDITQDNSGLVTITPSGEGVSSFDVIYGDTATVAGTVVPGGNIKHKYAEGQYNVKIVGHNIAGQTSSATQSLTVSYRAPENLQVNAAIDASNPFQVNVSATALYQTNFKVYFGDVANEVPQIFLQGQTVNHIYATTGTYTITVIAQSGGAATTQFTKSITIVDPVLLPLTFESSTVVYKFNNFAGGVVTVINNPQQNGINTSAKVAKMVKYNGETYGGSAIMLGKPIDFSVNKIFRMKVFSPRVGAKVLLKVENATNNTINFQSEVATTTANQWEDLVFDFSAISTSKSYQNIVLIFDNGTKGDGSANYTFLFDDLRLTNVLPPAVLALPLDFESPTLNYTFTNFNGGNVTIIDNPQKNGIDVSNKVGKMVKSNGEVYGGSYITLAQPIDFSTKKTFKVKVFSPKIGGKLLLKVENLTNGGISYEKEAATTTANQWETLTFDFSAINTANSYQKVVLIFDLGTVGDGSANFTYLFDDISLN